MNDMALVCEDVIFRSGGLAHPDLATLNRFRRRNINRARDDEEPIDLMTKRLLEGRPRLIE
jgi:hypothetical protein